MDPIACSTAGENGRDVLSECRLLHLARTALRWEARWTGTKLLDRLKSRPRDFTWSEACTLMAANGFEEQSGSGSRYKFVHSSGRLVSIHKPHPGNELKRYQVDDLIIALKEVGVITDE